jgi:hypothetical protein
MYTYKEVHKHSDEGLFKDYNAFGVIIAGHMKLLCGDLLEASANFKQKHSLIFTEVKRFDFEKSEEGTLAQ